MNIPTTNTGSENRGYKYLGIIMFDTALRIPLSNTTPDFENVDKTGLFRVNSVSNILEYHNGTAWIPSSINSLAGANGVSVAAGVIGLGAITPTSVTTVGSILNTISGNTVGFINGIKVLWNSGGISTALSKSSGQTIDIDVVMPDISGQLAIKSQVTSEITSAVTSKIKITTAVSVTTSTLASNGLGQNGRHVLIDNGANAINLTVNGDTTSSYTKTGSATITFVQGSGRTLVLLSGTAVMNGIAGSMATIVSDGTTDYLTITNY